MGWRPDGTDGIRERVTRGVFGAQGASLSADEADDDFARESLVAPRARRLRTALRDTTNDDTTTDEVATPAVRLPPISLGRKETAVALLLLAGLLSWLLDPALPVAMLTSLLGTTPYSQQTAVAPTGPLTPYDGWRVAYIGEDRRLYVVTTNGVTRLVGPQLPGLLPGGAYVASASPDGYHIAYASNTSGIALIDLTGAPAKPTVRAFPAAGTPLYWSPDGTRIAFTTVTGQLALFDVRSGKLSVLPTHAGPASLFQLGRCKLLGWIDSAHLALAVLDPQWGIAYVNDVNASSGVARTLVTLPVGSSLPGFALAPDGRRILAYANTQVDAPSAVWLIDTATGRVQEQPGIAQGLDGPIVAAVWNSTPGTLVVATLILPRNPQQVTTDPPSIHTWTLDTNEDFDSRQRPYGIPLGWMPGNGSLIYGVWSAAEGGTDSYVLLRTYTLTLRGPVVIYPLIGVAGDLTFVGFVRTR